MYTFVINREKERELYVKFALVLHVFSEQYVASNFNNQQVVEQVYANKLNYLSIEISIEIKKMPFLKRRALVLCEYIYKWKSAPKQKIMRSFNGNDDFKLSYSVNKL